MSPFARARISCVAILAIVSTRVSHAQIPTPAPPTTGSLAGVVRDIAGAPLSDVDLSLLGESIATRTDSTGRFSLDHVPAGSHTALFRRIGFRSVDYRWAALPGRELQAAVTMVPV